jgi:nitroreductase
MTTLSADDLVERLAWRYAVKRFDPTRKIPAAQWRALEQSLVLSASSYGLQPWRFFAVEDPAVRKKLRPASWNQSQVEDASHYVVVASKRTITEPDVDRHLARVAEVRKVSLDSLAGYRDKIVTNLIHGPAAAQIEHWTARQAYIAVGTFLTSAAALGIDACPMEGLSPQQYEEILGIKGGEWKVLCALAAGYRHAEDGYAKAAKVRFPVESIITRV